MLRPGEAAPPLTFPLVTGGTFDLHEARLESDYLLLEVYRGVHCGVCKAHLGALAAMKDELAGYGARIIAVSMNDRALALEAFEGWGLEALSVGYGLTEAAARTWGMYLSDRYRDSEPARFAEPATFLVRSDGILYAADVRSSPHLRPQLERLSTLVRRATEGYPPRGTA